MLADKPKHIQEGGHRRRWNWGSAFLRRGCEVGHAHARPWRVAKERNWSRRDEACAEESRPIRVVCITSYVCAWVARSNTESVSIANKYQLSIDFGTATDGNSRCTVQPGTQQPAVPRYCFRTGLIGARLLFVAVRHAAATCQASAAGRPFPLAHRPDGANTAVPACASVRRSPKRARWERDGMAMPCHSNGAGERPAKVSSRPALAWRLAASACLVLVVPTAPTTSTLPDVCLFGVLAGVSRSRHGS